MQLLLIVFIIALVILYMTYPRFLRRRVSSARFFRNLPPPSKNQAKFQRGKLQFTIPFFLQLVMLLFLLAALVFAVRGYRAGGSRHVGVWFIIDTSASMSTLQDGKSRMEATIKELEHIIGQLEKNHQGQDLCFRLSAFDLERRDIITSSGSQALITAAKTLTSRPLGTDTDIIRRLSLSLQSSSSSSDVSSQKGCSMTHVAVISDMPAPGWVSQNPDSRVTWVDIGKPVENIGFTAIHASRNPLTGHISQVNIEVTAFGVPSSNPVLSVTRPGGESVMSTSLQWAQGEVWSGSFNPGGAGKYFLKLDPGGNYSFDDTLTIEVPDTREIRVDWQLEDKDIPRQLGWNFDAVSPHLRVISYNSKPKDEIPTLIIGPGYAGNGISSPVGDFIESNPLLNDINLDAVESLGLSGIELPGDFRLQPVLRVGDGKTLVAQSQSPMRVYVQGLPTGTPDVKGRFSAAVFYNALRWLLQSRSVPPLYTLTTPYDLETSSRSVLHKDEGNTQRPTLSVGDISRIKPIAGKGNEVPLWPIFLAAAVLLFLIERVYSLGWKRMS